MRRRVQIVSETKPERIDSTLWAVMLIALVYFAVLIFIVAIFAR